MLPNAPVTKTFIFQPRDGAGAASSRREDMNSSSICGLKSARVGALAKLAEPKTRSSTSVPVEAPMDRHRQATPSRAELFEGLARVGFRVTTFVAVVVRKAVRKDEQQAIRRAGLGLENLARTTDSGAEAGITRRLELVEPGPPDGAEILVERLDGRQMHGVAALRSKRIDGDAVTELFQCDGQGGGRPALVVVHREPVGIGIDGRPGGVDQNEHAEIASKFAALQVDVLGRREAGLQIDEQVDERLDIEVVPVGTATQDLRAESDAGQPAPQHVVVRDTGIGDVGGDGQWKVDDPAPVRPCTGR